MSPFMNRSTIGAAALIGLACGAGWLAGCATQSASAPAASEPERVRRGRLERTLVLDGSLAAVRKQAVLVPRQAAWRHPIRWMVEHGSRVEAGDVVVEFDNQQAVQRLEEAELRVVSAINALVARQATGAGEVADKRVELARKQAEHDKAALEAAIPEGMRAQRDWQEKQLALRQAGTALAKAFDDLAAAEVGLAADVEVERLKLAKAERDAGQAEDSIELLSLEAPGAGIALIGEHPWHGRQLQLGDTAFAGLEAVSIPDLTEMRVEAYLSDVDDGLVVPGQRVSCVLDAHPGTSYPGVVAVVAPIATTPARTRSLRRSFRVTVDLAESAPELMIPGMSVRLEIEVETLDDVLIAPRESIARVDDAWRVRLGDGRWAEVELGPCDARGCLVLSGLEEGERLARSDLREAS